VLLDTNIRLENPFVDELLGDAVVVEFVATLLFACPAKRFAKPFVLTLLFAVVDVVVALVSLAVLSTFLSRLSKPFALLLDATVVVLLNTVLVLFGKSTPCIAGGICKLLSFLIYKSKK
jgi:hypothetical protein